MTGSNNCVMLEVTGVDRHRLENDLTRAEVLVREEAIKHRNGVLITRHSHNRFTIAVSDAVPFGLTREVSAC